MKSRTIVKSVAQNSGGRSVKVLFFLQFNMIVATISKTLLNFLAFQVKFDIFLHSNEFSERIL